MTRLSKVIEEVKAARVGERRPWIFDENGNIKNDVLVGEVLDLLEELKKFEVDITDEEIQYIVDNADESGNTYNGNCNISNALNWNIKGNKIVIMVHLRGDIRCGYSDYFAIETDYGFSELLELESATQHKMIPGTNMEADIWLFNEGFSVYDYDKQEEVGMFYDLELADLLQSIKEVK